MSTLSVISCVVILLFTALFLIRNSSAPLEISHTFHSVAPNTKLIVFVHGLAHPSIESVINLASEAIPDADQLIFHYDTRLVNNSSPYEIANEIETTVHDLDSKQDYQEIILIGHSMGGLLLRKAILWANEMDEDRIGNLGKRPWVKKVSRFVSLATINRGWSIAHMPFLMSIGIGFITALARLTGTGKLILSLRLGSPFVADSRVQWVNLSRGEGESPIPFTIHLVGDRDDVVTRKDSMDLLVAGKIVFVTLPNTSHAQIANALDGGATPKDVLRRKYVYHAIRGELVNLPIDHIGTGNVNHDIKRLVFIMHGIRDFGDWTQILKSTILANVPELTQELGVINHQYAWFPMLPFLLYWDRQKKVRIFMDLYTQSLAEYPNVETIDYIGHSNGTYILASCLQSYATPRFRRVLFAGSVVPRDYPWKELIDKSRVKRLVNIVAGDDIVVAVFPRFFEQLAEIFGLNQTTGFFDLGAGGFRGFSASGIAGGAVTNVQYAQGGHGAGVDSNNTTKMNCISAYILDNDIGGLNTYRQTTKPKALYSFLSRTTWLAIPGLVFVVIVIGWLLALLIDWAFTYVGGRPYPGVKEMFAFIYPIVIIGLLYTI